jgi:hypothetical protein
MNEYGRIQFMSPEEVSPARMSPPSPTSGEHVSEREAVFGLAPWAVLVAVLVVGGLLLAARAGDAYVGIVGILFAGFGALLGFRLLGRTLP